MNYGATHKGNSNNRKNIYKTKRIPWERSLSRILQIAGIIIQPLLQGCSEIAKKNQKVSLKVKELDMKRLSWRMGNLMDKFKKIYFPQLGRNKESK